MTTDDPVRVLSDGSSPPSPPQREPDGETGSEDRAHEARQQGVTTSDALVALLALKPQLEAQFAPIARAFADAAARMATSLQQTLAMFAPYPLPPHYSSGRRRKRKHGGQWPKLDRRRRLPPLWRVQQKQKRRQWAPFRPPQESDIERFEEDVRVMTDQAFEWASALEAGAVDDGLA